MCEIFGLTAKLSQKLYPSMIAVSKSCCPVCWELLKVLRNNGDVDPSDTSSKFAVRGFHSHIYPIVLPPWIQPSQKEQMISKFQIHLGSELVKMTSALKKIHLEDGMTHRRSGSSEISQASNSSKISQESSSVMSTASTTQGKKYSISKAVNSITARFRKIGIRRGDDL